MASYASGLFATRVLWPHDIEADSTPTPINDATPFIEWRGGSYPIEIASPPGGQQLEKVARGPLARLHDDMVAAEEGEKEETTTFQIHAIARVLTSEDISPEECKALPVADKTLQGSFCEGVARCVLDWYANPKPYARHYGPARAFLQREDIREDIPSERAKDAVLVLATALSNACVRLREHIQSRAPRADYPVVSKNGMLTMDALLCDFLEELGWKQTKDLRLACTLRFTEYGEGFDAWKTWFLKKEPRHENLAVRLTTLMEAKFVEYILHAIWPDTLEQLNRTSPPPSEEESDNNKIPTMPHVVTEALLGTLAPRNRVKVAPDQMHAQIISPEGELIAGPAKAATPFVESILQTNLDALRSAHGMRLLIWFAQTVHEQYAQNKRPGDNNMVIVEGGIAGLRETLGISSKKASSYLRDALNAGLAWQPTNCAGHGLWTWAERKAKRNRAALIYITAGLVFTPEGLWMHQGGSKLLTPIVDLAGMVGRYNEHAAVGRFQFALVHELSKGSAQIPEHGGVLLSQEVLERRAMQAGLPDAIITKAIDRWTQDGDDAPALLERIDKGRYHLADNSTYGKAREFLDEQGGMRKKRSQSGKRGGKRGKKGC